MMAPPELLEIGSHCCYGGTVYRFETWPVVWCGGTVSSSRFRKRGVPRLRMCWAYNVEPLAVAVERASAIILAVFIVILVVSVSSNLNLKNGVATTATN